MLVGITQCFGWTLVDLKDNKAKRLHVISPILWAVVRLVPDVTIYGEQNLEGDRVDAHEYFEFVLVRGDKRICIVEASDEVSRILPRHARFTCTPHLSLQVCMIATGYTLSLRMWRSVASDEFGRENSV